MIFGHYRLKIGSGQVPGVSLVPPPFHKQTIGYAPIGAQKQDALVALYPAAIIVIGNVQAQVQAIFYSPTVSVDLEPLSRIQLFRRETGDQSDLFVFAALFLAQEACPLAGEGKADIFAGQFGGGNHAILIQPLVLSLATGLGRRGLIRGGNPLGER